MALPEEGWGRDENPPGGGRGREWPGAMVLCGRLELKGVEVLAGAAQIPDRQLNKVPGANYSPWTGNLTPIFPNNRQGRGSWTARVLGWLRGETLLVWMIGSFRKI